MPTEASLRELFLAKVDEDLRPVFTDWTDLQQEIELALTAARNAWPQLTLSDSDFVGYLAERSLCEGEDPELPAFVADLFLACACLSGEAAALKAFEEQILSSANPTLVKLGLSPDDADDIRQELRERLLLGLGDRQPGLASYLGTGALKGWMRAVAGRQALASLRQKKPTSSLEDQIIEDSSDPILTALKEKYREDFKEALHQSVERLEARERTILRAMIIDDRSVADIAKLYKVHRVTASRWIATIRKHLFIRTRAALRTKLELSESELLSMTRLVESQMEMSLGRVLADSDD